PCQEQRRMIVALVTFEHQQMADVLAVVRERCGQRQGEPEALQPHPSKLRCAAPAPEGKDQGIEGSEPDDVAVQRFPDDRTHTARPRSMRRPTAKHRTPVIEAILDPLRSCPET